MSATAEMQAIAVTLAVAVTPAISISTDDIHSMTATIAGMQACNSRYESNNRTANTVETPTALH